MVTNDTNWPPHMEAECTLNENKLVHQRELVITRRLLLDDVNHRCDRLTVVQCVAASVLDPFSRHR